MALTTERQRIQHLLRRAAFGYTAAELDEYLALGLPGTVERLLTPESVTDTAAEAVYASGRERATQDRGALVTLWHTRMVLTRRPLLEKMTYFWHDHFATGIKKVDNPGLMLVQNETLRSGALGGFRDLLLAMTRDPAMLVWLDNRLNTAGAPNENYAREVMELFTLGQGVLYTEKDIKEVARALTGWRFRTEKRNPDDKFPYPTGAIFTPRQHDGGTKTILGATGRFGDEDVVDIITSKRACADYIGRKLWQFFAVPEPSDALVASTTEAYFANGTSIRAMLRTILRSDAMYSDEAYRWRILSPTEYVTRALRTFDAAGRAPRAVRDTQTMGQVLFDPPSVAGWDWGEAWINSNTLLARANFANDLTRAAKAGQYANAAALLRAAGATHSAAEAVDYVLDLVAGGDVDAETRALLMEHVGGEHHFDFQQAAKAGALQGMLYLALTMPLAHLA